MVKLALANDVSKPQRSKGLGIRKTSLHRIIAAYEGKAIK